MILKSFAETQLHEPVKYKVRHIANKMGLLDREIKYLLNKVKIWRPKQEPAVNQTENKTEPTINESEEPAEDTTSRSDSDTEKDKSKEQILPDNVEEQQETILEASDTTQDPLVISESENSHIDNDEVAEEIHQEL